MYHFGFHLIVELKPQENLPAWQSRTEKSENRPFRYLFREMNNRLFPEKNYSGILSNFNLSSWE